MKPWLPIEQDELSFRRLGDFRDRLLTKAVKLMTRCTIADFGHPTERVVARRADLADTVCKIGEAGLLKPEALTKTTS